jgi:guanylate kinase
MRLKNRRKGATVFVISGPSGCGKTTLCERLIKRQPMLIRSISVTTRAPRKGESAGRDYIFSSYKLFKRDLKMGRFLEHARVFGRYYYGTPKRPVEDALARGKDVILCIDVQGAAKIKRIIQNAVFIFILPPSLEELRRRLLRRSSEDPVQAAKRLKIAKAEMRSIDMYDYAVVNDDVKTAVEQLVSIVSASKNRIYKRR